MQQILDEIDRWLAGLTTEPWLAAVIIGVALALGLVLHWSLGRLVRLTGRTRTDVDDKLLRVIQAPSVQTVVLAGLLLASRRLGMPEQAWLFAGHGLATLALIIWTRAALRASVVLLTFVSERSDTLPLIEKRTYPLFSNLTVLVVLGLSVYVLLLIWDVDATGWAASAGVVGLAFGFAAKDTLSNLFSGVFIVADAPYQLEDYIVLDSGVRGRVEHIGLRSTRILTRDDVQITIPNAVIANSRIVNQSGGGSTRMRVRVAVSVSYDADIDLVRSLLTEIADGAPLIIHQPQPQVRFRNLGESGLDFELLGWVKDPADRGRAVDHINTAIIERFRTAKIEIPYPQRTVHLQRG